MIYTVYAPLICYFAFVAEARMVLYSSETHAAKVPCHSLSSSFFLVLSYQELCMAFCALVCMFLATIPLNTESPESVRLVICQVTGGLYVVEYH